MFENKTPSAAPAQPPSTVRESAEEFTAKLKDPHFLPNLADLSAQLDPLPNSDFDTWKRLVDDPQQRVFEILTKEYVDALAGYLSKRAFELGGTPEQPLVILEVGAGNGRLAHFLGKSLSESPESCAKVIAVDSGTWEIEPLFPVERLGAREALEKHQPSIVIFSWMPPGEDCSKEFRQAPSVKEYLLIGEPDQSTCGDPWDTWGKAQPGYDEDVLKVDWVPPYEADGFVRNNLDELTSLQRSRLSVVYRLELSATVSFVRA